MLVLEPHEAGTVPGSDAAPEADDRPRRQAPPDGDLDRSSASLDRSWAHLVRLSASWAHLGQLPATIRTGLAILGFFGLADVVAHLGVPTGSGPGSADTGQFVAHLGVLVGMIVVVLGVVVDGARAGRAPRQIGGPSGRPPREAEACPQRPPIVLDPIQRKGGT